MYEQLLNQISSFNFSDTISQYIDMLAGIVNDYLSSTDNLRLVSVFLMITALIMFLLLIIFIYIKSVITSFRKNKTANNYETDDIFDEEDALELSKIIENQEKELELEKELQKELELALADRDKKDKQKKKNEKEKEEEKEEENKLKQIEIKKNEESKKNKKKRATVDLDWQKGKVITKENTDSTQINSELLSYHQQNVQLSDLTGLVVDMIARGVDDLKIAQTIMYRNNYISSEEDVLHMVEAIKEFIDMCRNNKFESIIKEHNLPSEEIVLYHLAEGDSSLALFLLEKNMDYTIDEAEAQKNETKKVLIFENIAKSAILFGNLAAINDIHLATGSFELAVETEPHNVVAWSRLADMYSKAQSENNAIGAYQNVLNLADENINPREVANANKNLSQHFYAQGNSLQAAKLYNSSKQFYDSLGINRRLDKQECDIVDIIEQNHKNEIVFTVQKLLSSGQGKGFSFD